MVQIDWFSFQFLTSFQSSCFFPIFSQSVFCCTVSVVDVDTRRKKQSHSISTHLTLLKFCLHWHICRGIHTSTQDCRCFSSTLTLTHIHPSCKSVKNLSKQQTIFVSVCTWFLFSGFCERIRCSWAIHFLLVHIWMAAKFIWIICWRWSKHWNKL